MVETDSAIIPGSVILQLYILTHNMNMYFGNSLKNDSEGLAE
jgi:hypothetical protein